MDFRQYNRFPVKTKLIGFLYMLLNPEQMLLPYWKAGILMLFIYNHSTCGISKEYVSKDDQNGYADRYKKEIFGGICQ